MEENLKGQEASPPEPEENLGAEDQGKEPEEKENNLENKINRLFEEFENVKKEVEETNKEKEELIEKNKTQFTIAKLKEKDLLDLFDLIDINKSEEEIENNINLLEEKINSLVENKVTDEVKKRMSELSYTPHGNKKVYPTNDRNKFRNFIKGL